MKAQCIIDSCNKGRYGKQLFCEYHYRRNLKYGDPLYKYKSNTDNKCMIEGCSNKYYAKDYCQKHYRMYISDLKAKELRKEIKEKLSVENIKHVSMRRIFEYIIDKYNVDLEKEIKEYWSETKNSY